MKKAIIIFILPLFLVPAADTLSATTIGMYASGDRCHTYVEAVTPYSTFDCWIFVDPGTAGAKCLEFKIGLPENLLLVDFEYNPIFGITIVPIEPWESPGASWCFEPCQTDWFWTHRITFMTTDMNPSIIETLPHEMSGLVTLTTCADVENEIDYQFHFCVNQYCGPITPDVPFLHSVRLCTYTTLIAGFEPRLDGEDYTFSSGYVQAEDYPEDNIEVTGHELHPSGDGSAILTLASPMTHGRVYELHANTCGRCDCLTTYMPFYFDEETDARKSTWGAIKGLWK